MAKRPKSGKAGSVAANRARYREELHRRNADGEYADKPGAGDDAPKKGRRLVGAERLKTSGVTADDRIEVLSTRVRAYRGATTVRDFVDNHPKGRAYALRKLAADHKKGVIGFSEGGSARPKPAAPKVLAKDPSKYDEKKFSDFSDTDTATVREVERDLYRQMLKKPETDAEIAAINNYSGLSYTEINGFLRGRPATGNKTKIYDEEDIGPEIRHLDNVMKRSRMTEDTVVYRGLSGDYAKTVLQSKVGKIIKDAGFVSTSLHRNVADG